MAALVGFILGLIELFFFILPVYAMLQNLATKKWQELNDEYKKFWTTYWISVAFIYGVASPLLMTLCGERLFQTISFLRTLSIFLLYSPFTSGINYVHFFVFEERENSNPTVEKLRGMVRKALITSRLLE
jgi:hypothetical protein